MQIGSLLPDHNKSGQLPVFGGGSLIKPNFQNCSGGSNQLGSQRSTSLNTSVKDRNQDAVCLSMVVANCFEGMTVTELRIEDYYLIRTGGLNSAQQDQIRKHIEKQCFNQQIFQNINYKTIPNFGVKNNTVNEKVQTIDKRLQMLSMPLPTSKGSTVLGRQSSNLVPIVPMQPLTFKTQLPSPIKNQLQFPLGKDQQFKDYYQKQLLKLTQKQNVRQMLEYYLEKEVKQRVGQLKTITCDEELIKQYREIIEMRAILEQFRADQYRRMRAGALPEQERTEAEKMWAAFLEIYTQRLMTIYNNYHGRLTADILKQFVTQIKNQQLKRLFQMENYKISPHKTAQMINQIKQHDDSKLINTGQQLSSLWTNAKQIHITREMEMINTLKLKFKALCQRERIERSFHLYDVVYPYEQTGNIDDYFKFNEEPNQSIVYVDRKSTKKSYHNRLNNSNVRTVQVGSQVQQFLPLQSRRYDRLSPLVVMYLFRVVWMGSLTVYKELKGKLQLPRQSTTHYIYESLQIKMREEEKKLIKSDANFQFFELVSTSQIGVYNLDGNIWQQIINLPNKYAYNFKEMKNLIAEGFIIQNDFGKMEWQQKVNLEGIDFNTDELRIQENCVVCEPEGLNRKCRVTFKSLPSLIAKLKISEGREAAEKALKKCVSKLQGCRLQNIQWGQSTSYSLLFSRFDRNKCDSD